MNNVKSKNKSLFLVLAASFKARGINHFAPTKINITRPMNVIITLGIVCISRAEPPSNGVIKITTITAIS